jgi:hypothetical protein
LTLEVKTFVTQPATPVPLSGSRRFGVARGRGALRNAASAFARSLDQ